MRVLKLSLFVIVLAVQTALAAGVATEEWTYEFGETVLQPAPYPDYKHAEGILLTGRSGQVRLIAPGGRVLASMQLDADPTTNAIPVVFRRGEETQIVAADKDGSIYCFRRSGERVWKYEHNGKADGYKLLTIADLDGRGANDVLLSDSRGHLYAVDASGHLRFEVTATTYRVSPAAVAEAAGEGGAEVVFATEDHEVYAVRADGQYLWRTEVEGSLGRGLPLITTLGSNQPVVLVSTPYQGKTQGVNALDAVTGKPLWVAPSLQQVYQATAVADIDGDGVPEIVFGDKSNHVLCSDSHGHPRWNVLLDGRGIIYAMAIADLSGRGRATLFQAVRDAGTNGKSLYAIQADGTVIDSWKLPGGGLTSPILCRWQNESEIHLLVAGSSGNLVAFRLQQNPGAKILWTGLQGRLAGPPTSTGHASAAPNSIATSAARAVSISLGTTTISAQAAGAKVVSLRIVDPDGAVHLTLMKPENQAPVTGELVASAAGNYEVTTDWYANDSKPLRTEHVTYRASAGLDLPVPTGSGELAAYLRARVGEARQLALASGKLADYDAARGEADYAQALSRAMVGRHISDPVMVKVVQNPWAQHNPTLLLKEPIISSGGIQVQMLGNEYASAAVAFTNLTAHAITLELRTSEPSVVQFRSVPMIVPEPTGKPQEDPLPLLGRDQTLHLGPAETRELWLTLHSRTLEAGNHKVTVQAFMLERIAPPVEIPLELKILAHQASRAPQLQTLQLAIPRVDQGRASARRHHPGRGGARDERLQHSGTNGERELRRKPARRRHCLAGRLDSTPAGRVLHGGRLGWRQVAHGLLGGCRHAGERLPPGRALVRRSHAGLGPELHRLCDVSAGRTGPGGWRCRLRSIRGDREAHQGGGPADASLCGPHRRSDAKIARPIDGLGGCLVPRFGRFSALPGGVHRHVQPGQTVLAL